MRQRTLCSPRGKNQASNKTSFLASAKSLVLLERKGRHRHHHHHQHTYTNTESATVSVVLFLPGGKSSQRRRVHNRLAQQLYKLQLPTTIIGCSQLGVLLVRLQLQLPVLSTLRGHSPVVVVQSRTKLAHIYSRHTTATSSTNTLKW